MFRDVLFMNWIPFGASSMKKCGKNVIIYKCLMPMIADILILGCNCLLIMCSVYLKRGLTIYFIVFKGFPQQVSFAFVRYMFTSVKSVFLYL